MPDIGGKMQTMGRMSHEIRTPINTILGYSELLKETIRGCQTCNTGTSVEYINQIISSGRHLLALINEIFDSSELSSKSLPVDMAVETAEPRKAPDGIIKIKLDYEKEFRPNLLEALKKAEEQRRAISKAMILRDVESFAAEIITIGKQYNSTALAQWGKKLEEHASNLNKSEMETMLRWFPEIVIKVEKQMPGAATIKLMD